MPRVDFYVTEEASPNARVRVACRIVEKAYLAEQRVLVTCNDTAELERFDELLWTFADGSFVPHEAVSDAQQAITAPVALTAGPRPAGRWDVLINLAASVPADWQAFARVAEVLDADAETRAAGRIRFRVYRDAGITPETHNLARANA